jgi:hypothetical protein
MKKGGEEGVEREDEKQRRGKKEEGREAMWR